MDLRGLLDVAIKRKKKTNNTVSQSPGGSVLFPCTDVRSSTELHTGVPPLRVLHVLRDLLHTVLESDHSDGVRVRLSKHRSQPRDLEALLEGELGRMNLDVPLDPLCTVGLDRFELGGSDWSFVGEIKSELGGRDEGSFLVDVVAEDFSKGVVEDVRAGVVLSERRSSALLNQTNLIKNQPR